MLVERYVEQCSGMELVVGAGGYRLQSVEEERKGYRFPEKT